MNPRNAMALTHPQAVMIQTTSRCNSACIMCPQPRLRTKMPQGEMDEATFAALIAEIAEFPLLKRVMLYLMNEPLLDPRIVERVEKTRAALPDTEIYLVSNGVALTDELTDRLLDAGLTWMGFSLHAARPETYRTITGRNDFDAVRKRIVRFVEKSITRHGPDSVMVNMTRIRPHVGDEEWREGIAFWRERGLTRLDLVDGYVSRAGNVEVFEHEALRHPGILGCKTVWAYEMAHVLFDGAVVPCCMDYRRRAVWGHVGEAGLLAVWQGDKRRDFLEQMDGRPLPDDHLCIRCEDAIPADIAATTKSDTAEVEPEQPTSSEPPALLLVHPPPWLTSGPPLGMASLKSWLARDGFTVETFDVNIELYDAVPPAQQRLWEWEEGRVWERAGEVERLFGSELRKLARRIARHPAPVIGFSLASRKEIAAAILAREIHRLAPDKLLIAGGPATAVREDRDRLFDLCRGAIRVFVVGEGEAVLSALLQRHARGKSPEGLPGVAFYREGEATFVDPPDALDITNLPTPDFRDFDLDRYTAPALHVEWSRGCTGNCAFCNIRQYWRRYRTKTAAQVLAEIETLIERHDAQWLSLVDPVLNGRPETLEEICDGILERGWKLRWSAGMSPNHQLSGEQFEKLARAGCYRLEFGLESGSDDVLRAMNKRYTVAEALAMCRAADAAGIDVVLYLIVGFPGESDADFQATLDAVASIAPHVKLVRSVNGLLLIPGADVCEHAEKFGLEPPQRDQPGWERRWATDDLNAEIRAERCRRLLDHLDALGVPVEFSNRDEIVSEKVRFAERLTALDERLGRVHQRLVNLALAADNLLEHGPRPSSGGMVALAICPVWGVDMPPYGLASLAANTQRADFAPVVFDFNIDVYRRVRPELKRFWEEDSFRHWTDHAEWRRLLPHLESEIDWVARRLLDTGRPVIGLSCYSPNRRFTIEVCKRLKELDVARTIVVGGRGVHTANERLLFPPGSVDMFVVGEGEATFIELLQCMKDGGDPRGLAGIDYFDGHHLAGAAPRELIADVGTLAPPDYTPFPLSSYRTRDLPILMSRGCIGHCTFCNDHPAMGRFRCRPGRDVADEMLHHRRVTGAHTFRFNDQLINGDLDALDEMCDALIAADADMEWIALAAPRGDMSPELLAKAKRAGCRTLNLGIESGSDAVLKKMAKGYRVADIETALARLRAAGINTMLNFIVGFPGETEADFQLTLDLVRRLRPHICGVNSINTCILLLGSPLEQSKEKLGIVIPTGADPDTGWVQGENTPALRQTRARRLVALLEELDIPARVSNLHEKAADLRALEMPTVAAAESRDETAIQKGEPRYESVSAQQVDVLLVMPPVWGIDVPPLGIAYIHTYLAKYGISSQCLDLNIKLYNRAPNPSLWRMDAYKHWTDPELFAETMAQLADLIDHYVVQITAHPAKIVGLSLNTGNFAFGRAFARRLKAARPDRLVVLGGPGITNSFDIATLTEDEADYMVLGEGEVSGRQLFAALLRGQKPDVPGVLRVGDGVDFDHLVRPICTDLATLDFPRLEDFNFAEYGTDAVPILGSRGCIRRCTFCNDHHIYQKFRRRDPASVAAEMAWHADRGRLRFTFHDVLINGSISDLDGLCDLLIADGREYQWGGQGVIRKEMTPELFAKMKRAGCQSFVFGVESFSDKVLQLMNKPYTPELAHEVLTTCHGAGIETIINIIAGFPGEGDKEFRETFNFLRDHFEIIDQVASISPCLINLGSRLFDRYEEYGIRFPQSDGSIKWYTDDGNTFEERRRRVLALTTLLARRDHSVHTVNLYDEASGALPEVDFDAPEDDAHQPEEANRPEPAALVPPPRPDVLLVMPPPWGVEYPPLGLAQLAGGLRSDGFRAATRDLNIEWYAACGGWMQDYWKLDNLKYWSPEGRLEEIIAYFQPQIEAFIAEVRRLRPKAVGFSTNESNLPLAVHLAARIKETAAEIVTIFGGPGIHWEADRERIGPAADLCIVGEGEATLPEVLRALKSGVVSDQTPGVAVWREDRWVCGPPRPLVKDLDSLPLPDFGDLPLHLYRTNQFPLLFGRGCINRCAFCNDHQMIPGYRAISPERLVDHILSLKRRFGAFAFSFNDLLINADLPRLRHLCRLLIDQDIRLAWTGQAVVRDDMTDEDFALLKKAGCASLVFGVESFSDEVLRRMGKRFDAESAQKTLRRAKDAGLHVLANLIVGFPGETEESFRQTCDFVRDHADLIDQVSALSTCIVVAQSRLEKEPEEFGIVLPQPEHWCQWYSQDGENTYEIRTKRLAELTRILDEAGIAHGMVNLYREALQR
ncbi:MAG: radical SAM protein [Candidatus Lernaella stagnicola]|nr:radical SAM protein [Candidatus Lernaella stagnicola]